MAKLTRDEFGGQHTMRARAYTVAAPFPHSTSLPDTSGPLDETEEVK